jgi:hypothetical protein
LAFFRRDDFLKIIFLIQNKNQKNEEDKCLLSKEHPFFLELLKAPSTTKNT